MNNHIRDINNPGNLKREPAMFPFFSFKLLVFEISHSFQEKGATNHEEGNKK